MSIKLSIVIPAYNEEALLGRCLEAVVREVGRASCQAEIVVVNNASTDRTRTIAESYPGVRVVRVGIEGILGIRREGAVLVIAPHIPRSWPGYEANVKVGSTSYEIRVRYSSERRSGASEVILDVSNIECINRSVSVPLDGGNHSLVVNVPRQSRSMFDSN